MKSSERPSWWQWIGAEELDAALATLDPRFSEPIRLQRQGLSVAQIATRLNTRPSTVAARIFRGRRRLRQILEAEVDRLSGSGS